MNACSLPDKELGAFAAQIASTARDNDIKAASCAETIDLSACGIEHNCCIDK